MSRNRLYLTLGLAIAALGALGSSARAQAPATTSNTVPRATTDSNALWGGDWDFTMQIRDSTIGGGWRLNYNQSRFSGIVARPGLAPSAIKSFTLRGSRDMTMTVDWNGETYTFTGHLENPRNITGTVSGAGATGRLRAQKRG